MLKITYIRPINPHSGSSLRAIVSILIHDKWAVHDIKILEKEKGKLTICMPSQKDNKGVYRNVVHPIDSTTREEMETLIIRTYQERTYQE